MIVRHTFLDRCNTIVKDSSVNTGLNPVMELNYGNMLSRCMIHFDHSKIKNLVDDKTFPDITKLKHILKMTNMASITDKTINNPFYDSQYNGIRERAISFDLVFFLIPYDWDSGRGYDYVQDLYNGSHRTVSVHGSNWYQYRDYCEWDDEGIYSTDRLSSELDLFTSPAEDVTSPVVIGYQHFDYGNEPIILDITDTFNKFITGELENYGIGIAFSPQFEETKTERSQYVGFFTNTTHSFYEPYVETTYEDTIVDDRNSFYLDKKNKLYFYANVGSERVNLDTLPTCTINEVEYEVKQATKGAYYIEAIFSSDEFEPDTMMYDTWSNIVYNGKSIKPVELDFVLKQPDGFYSFGLPSTTSSSAAYVPSTSGIDNNEQIKRGDVRKVKVNLRIPYTSNQMQSADGLDYRLYVKEGLKEHNVIDWTPCERGYDGNYFLLATEDFVPFRYYIDMRVKFNDEVRLYEDRVHFDIVSETDYHYV